MQEVIHFEFDEIAYEFIHADSTIGFHSQRTQFDLRLRLELRFLDIDGYSCYNTRTDIAIFVVLIEEFLNCSGNVFFERALMSTTLDGVLTIYERMVLFAILLVGMCKGNLDVIAFQMHDIVKRSRIHRIYQQVFQTVSRYNSPAIIINFKSCVQVGVVAEHGLHKLWLELIIEEKRIVWLKLYKCSIFLVRIGCFIGFYDTLLEGSHSHLSIAV